MTKNLSVEEVDAFMRQLKYLIAGVIAIFLVPLVIYAYYLDGRLDQFENSLRYKPPQESFDHIEESEIANVIAHPAQGQIVYVPAYSHIYHDDGDPYLLTITLSVRNTSIDREIVVKSVRYFDTNGKEVKSYLERPVRLSPLATTEILIERKDTSGGSGANFLVEWLAKQEVSEPIIEAVMIDTSQQQGISFVCKGVVVREMHSDPTEQQSDDDAHTDSQPQLQSP